MKVLLVNGSPHKKGCTYTALNIVRESLKKEDIEADIFWIENKPLTWCIGCGYCANLFTFELKPAAVVTSARRAGTTATLD